MAFDILSIKQVYENEELNFSTDEERGLIRFSMNTEVSPDVRFMARVVNPRTALFSTILPMNIPEKSRIAVSQYLTYVNYTLLLGNISALICSINMYLAFLPLFMAAKIPKKPLMKSTTRTTTK